MAKKLKLEGLDCASCAYEIEEALKKEGFEFALVNFTTSELVIEGDIEKAKEIVKKVEPGVKIIEKKEHHDHDEDPRKMLYFIIPSLVLFTVGMLLRYYYNYDNAFVLGIFVASYLLVGWKVLRNAFVNSVHGNVFDENFLIAIATLGAFAIREYPEAVGVMLFYIVGEFFQDLAVNKSRRSIKALLSLKAEYANLKVGGNLIKVKPEELKVGDIIVIKPGERVPVDGIVLEGSSSVDTSALTGESVPRTIREGEEILSGMVNLSGLLTVRVTKELKESTISRILELVENASARKAKTEKFITKFAHYYTPAVVGLAALVALIPPLAFGEPFSKWVYRALVLLVISCPCALVLSIPLGYFGGIGRAAREGILVKGSNFLDALSKATIVAFDKTGTLTEGKFEVMDVIPLDDLSEEEILRYAATLESHSSHPIAQGIVEKAEELGLEIYEVRESRVLPGKGVQGVINGKEVLVVSPGFLKERNLWRENERVNKVLEQGKTVVFLVIDGKLIGALALADKIRPESKEAIKNCTRWELELICSQETMKKLPSGLLRSLA